MKKIVSMVLAIAMMMSVSVYAADYFVGKDAQGNITEYYNSTKSVLNIDIGSQHSIKSGVLYDDSTLVALDEGTPEFSNGATNVKNQVNFSAGSENNSISISDDKSVADDKHTNFIKLETTAEGKASQCQMNNLPIRTSGGITVVQNDFCLDTIPEDRVYVSYLQLSAPDVEKYTTGSIVRVKNDATIQAGTNTTDFEIEAKKWYTVTQVVFHDQKRIDYYVDGKYLGCDSNENYSWLWKLNIDNTAQNETPQITYFDNIKIYKATTDIVTLTQETSGTTAAEGVPVVLKATNLNTDIVKNIKIMSSTDDINYTDYAASNKAIAYYKSYTTYYKAVAFDNDGNKLAESEPVTLATKYVKNTEYWNLDFNDESYTLSNGNLKKNNADYTVNGNVFKTNAGANCTTSLTNAPISGNTYGRSLTLNASANANAAGTQAQINEIQLGENHAGVSGTILVTEFDFAFSQLPTKLGNAVLRPQIASSYKKTARLELSVNGKLHVASESNTSGVAAEANKWYHICQVINLGTKKIDFYIDGTHLITTELDTENATINKITATTNESGSTGANNNILYYDNLKIYSVAAPSNPELKIEKAEYFINGAPADQIAAGTLTAKVTLSNNSAANASLSCIAAVYGAGNELVRVDVVPVSFTAAELSKLVELSFGTVAADNTVKIFFWDANSVPKGANKDF